MSEVKWCDIGDHPYPANQPGATTLKLTQQTSNQWGGFQPTDVVQDVCAACADEMGMTRLEKRGTESQEVTLTRARDTRMRMGGRVKRELEALEPVKNPPEQHQRGYDPEYVKWLEEKNHIGEPAETEPVNGEA